MSSSPDMDTIITETKLNWKIIYCKLSQMQGQKWSPNWGPKLRGCIQKFPDWVDNETNNNNNNDDDDDALRRNIKGYSGKTH
jgi:hypothetical protein